MALTTLSSIFNSKRFQEKIEDAYVSRFILAIMKGLEADVVVKCSILQNIDNLLYKNISGINMVLPSLLKSLQGFAEAPLSMDCVNLDVRNSSFKEN